MNQIAPAAGFSFTADSITVSEGEQAEKLGCIGLDPARFGRFIDPSFFIGMGIRAGASAGISAEGNVNMLSRIVQHRPLLLDELLIPKGRIEAVDQVPRGQRVTTDAWFEGEDGGRAVSVPRQSLRPDPALASRGAGERPAPVIEDAAGLEVRGEFTLTPEATRAYSTEGNSIHYEMEAANRAGFRAPIIGGGMGVHFLVYELWGGNGLRELDMDIYFRRPIFWDDTFEIGLDLSGKAIALVKAGKVLTEARINKMEKVTW